jgi:hypothetical protein
MSPAKRRPIAPGASWDRADKPPMGAGHAQAQEALGALVRADAEKCWRVRHGSEGLPRAGEFLPMIRMAKREDFIAIADVLDENQRRMLRAIAPKLRQRGR